MLFTSLNFSNKQGWLSSISCVLGSSLIENAPFFFTCNEFYLIRIAAIYASGFSIHTHGFSFATDEYFDNPHAIPARTTRWIGSSTRFFKHGSAERRIMRRTNSAQVVSYSTP